MSIATDVQLHASIILYCLALKENVEHKDLSIDQEVGQSYLYGLGLIHTIAPISNSQQT